MSNPSWGLRLGTHTMYYGAGLLIEKAVAFAMLPVYTRYMTPSDYGVMSLVALTLDIVMIVAGARLANGVHRYYHKAEGEAEKKAVVSTALTLLAVTFGSLGVVCWFLAADLSRLVIGTAEHTVLFQLASASLGLQGLLIVPMAYLRVRSQAKTYTIVIVSKLALQASMNFYFLAAMGMGPKGMFLSTLIVTALAAGVLSTVTLRQTGWSFSGLAANSLVRYGLPLIGVQVASFVVTFGDRYFLKAHTAVAVVGIYSLAYQFGFLVSGIGYQPFAIMWEPTRFEVAKRPNRDQLFARAFINMNVLMMTVAVGTIVFERDVIRLMAAPAFHGAADLVPIIVLAYVIQSWFAFHEVGILVSERTEFVTLATWVSAGVVLLGYATLIPRWLAWGAAIATVLAFVARLVITLIISQKLWTVRYDWPPVVRLAALSVATCLIAIAIRPQSIALALAAHSVVFALFVTALWRLPIVAGPDRAMITGVVRGALSRFGPRSRAARPSG